MSSYVETEQEQALRCDLAASFHMAVKFNLHEGIANHFSVVLPDSQHYLVNPLGLHFSEIKASNLIVCDFNGDVVKGEGIPSPAAKNIHSPIHRLVPKASVIMHTHQPYATALTMLENGHLEFALQTTCRFYDRVAYDSDYDGVALSDSVGERMAQLIGNADVLFLGNHGLVTLAPTIAQAFDDLYFIERIAETQLLAMSSGQPLKKLSDKIIQKVARQTHYERFEMGYIDIHFNALKRVLDNEGVDYAS